MRQCSWMPMMSIPTSEQPMNNWWEYGCESWVISQDMENKINAFAISCYRVMLNMKRIDHVLNTTVYSMTNTVPLIHLLRHRQLKFLGHILRMSKEEPARRYVLYIPTIGKRRPGRPRTSYLNYVQRLLGDNEGAMQEQQIAAFADDRHAWRNLVVACSAADGWWWWWWWTNKRLNCTQNVFYDLLALTWRFSFYRSNLFLFASLFIRTSCVRKNRPIQYFFFIAEKVNKAQQQHSKGQKHNSSVCKKIFKWYHSMVMCNIYGPLSGEW